MTKGRHAGEKKNMHIVGEEGFEEHVNLVILSTSVEQSEQCYQSAGAALSPWNKVGTLLENGCSC